MTVIGVSVRSALPLCALPLGVDNIYNRIFRKLNLPDSDQYAVPVVDNYYSSTMYVLARRKSKSRRAGYERAGRRTH